MKSLLYLTVFISLLNNAIAQVGLPAFGKIEKEDLETSLCPFDKDAAAFKLIDFGKVYYTKGPDSSNPFITMYERRIRIKILKDAGIAYANLTIPFYTYNNDERIVRLDACTFNITGDLKIKKTNVSKSSIYHRKINKHYSEWIAVFPEVKVGSVIEYKYLIERKSIAEIRDWYFQSSLPTRHSECQINIPSQFRYSIHPLTADPLEIKETPFTDRFITGGKALPISGFQKNFTMRNLPAVSNEPFMSSTKDYLQRLSFMIAEIDYGNGNFVNIHSEWYEVVAGLLNDDDFGGQIKKTLSPTVTVVANAKKLDSIDSRIAFVFDYIKEIMTWNGQENIYSFEGIGKIFKNKTGSSGDINLLLISILNQAGIKALPVLFSTRDHGYVNTSLPLLSQFNTVMALVENENGLYILDAAGKNGQYNLYPDKILNTKGFIVENEEGRWLNVTDTINKYKVTTAIRGDISEDGMISGEVFISYSGYARKKVLDDRSANQEYYEKLNDDRNKLTIHKQESGDIKNYKLPFEQKLQYSLPLSKAGELKYFKLILFSELEKTQFITQERHSDIDFGYQQEYNLYGNYKIPGDYIFEDLPENLSLIMPDTSIIFKRYLSIENNSLNVRVSIDFKRSWFSKLQYTEFASFYKMVLSRLNETVAIKKKD